MKYREVYLAINEGLKKEAGMQKEALTAPGKMIPQIKAMAKYIRDGARAAGKAFYTSQLTSPEVYKYGLQPGQISLQQLGLNDKAVKHAEKITRLLHKAVRPGSVVGSQPAYVSNTDNPISGNVKKLIRALRSAVQGQTFKDYTGLRDPLLTSVDPYWINVRKRNIGWRNADIKRLLSTTNPNIPRLKELLNQKYTLF